MGRFLDLYPDASEDAVCQKYSKSIALIVNMKPPVCECKLQNYQSGCVYGSHWCSQGAIPPKIIRKYSYFVL